MRPAQRPDGGNGGQVLTWGTNDYGQLGNGEKGSRELGCGECTSLWKLSFWESFDAYDLSHLAIQGNTSYQIEPKPVMGMDGVQIAQIAAGGWHSLALTGDGKVSL